MKEIEQYAQYLRQEKGASENTAASYVRDVKQFTTWTAQQRLELEEVREEDVERYVRHLGAVGRSLATMKRSAASLKSFFGFLQREGRVKRNCAQSIATQKLSRKLPQVLSSKEVELFLEQPHGNDPKGIRDKAMLELLYATGIRVTELIGLTTENVHLEGGFIRFQSRKKERTVPLYPAAVKALEDYMERVRPTLVLSPEEKTLFVNMSGEGMSRQGFWKLVKHYQVMAGIGTEITPQTLRHSFAAHLVANGVDLHSLQEMLGHADLSTTQVYTKVAEQKLKEVYSKAHPRASE